MLLRDAQHSPSHSNFLLPSSRATVYDAEHGWILCRINCPVDFVTEVRDIAQTVTRWKTTLHTLRPGCADNVAPCTNAVMLDIIDTALRSVDIFAADLQPFNSLMILMAVELSDMDMYAANSTAGAEPGYARLRKESPEVVPTSLSFLLVLADSLLLISCSLFTSPPSSILFKSAHPTANLG
jgi:hypothetical protein